MATCFISDLHLCPDLPVVTEGFLRFCRELPADVEALYVLGDLFEAWVGDDDDRPYPQSIIQAFRNLSERGVRLYFVHGNRDFMLGQGFAQATGGTLLGDSTLIDLYGRSALVMHGDSLCTLDKKYQLFRRVVRTRAFQALICTLPLTRRIALAESLRARSRMDNASKAANILDVTPTEVERVMREAGVDLLIHGHTHRPAVHELVMDGRPAQRMVLGDWTDRGWMIRADAEGVTLSHFPLP